MEASSQGAARKAPGPVPVFFWGGGQIPNRLTRRSPQVLESCMKSCGKRFHDEVGKFRFLNELIKVVSPKVGPAGILLEATPVGWEGGDAGRTFSPCCWSAFTRSWQILVAGGWGPASPDATGACETSELIREPGAGFCCISAGLCLRSGASLGSDAVTPVLQGVPAGLRRSEGKPRPGQRCSGQPVGSTSSLPAPLLLLFLPSARAGSSCRQQARG